MHDQSARELLHRPRFCARTQPLLFEEVIPEALPQLERELERAAAASSSSSPLLPGEAFFASRSPEECGGRVWEEWEGRATSGRAASCRGGE